MSLCQKEDVAIKAEDEASSQDTLPLTQLRSWPVVVHLRYRASSPHTSVGWGVAFHQVDAILEVCSRPIPWQHTRRLELQLHGIR